MKFEAIVIGASTGGLNALQTVIEPIPADFSLPIIVVQHRLPALNDFLVFSLNASGQLTVKEAAEKEAIQPGIVYIGPANYHLLVERDKTLSLSIDAKVCYSRPAIDVLFETAAETYRSGLVGIILTGANEDGTAGLKKIKQHGGLTVAQNPATAEAALMPASAIRENIVDKICSLTEISALLIQLSGQGTSHERESSAPQNPDR